MKTFDEAMDSVCIAASSGKDADSVMKVMEERFSAFEAIADEASASEQVDALIHGHVELAKSCGDVHVVLFSIFMVGVTVGIEMERAEMGQLAK